MVITQESIKSHFVEQELAFASSQWSWFVPIVVGSPKIPRDIKLLISNCKYISAIPTEDEFNEVIDIMDDVIKNKISILSSSYY